jgi:hypothetical protein
MKNLFTPGATLCPIKTPDILSCKPSPTIIKSTQVHRFVNLIRNQQVTKVVFGNEGYVYVSQQKLQVGRKTEGQLGGILGKPKNF